MIAVQHTERPAVDVFTCGEPLASLTSAGRLMHTQTLSKSIGGAEANVAVGLARLGATSTYLTCVGADPFGDEVLRTLRAEGVDVSAVRRDKTRPTGAMFKERLAPNHVNVYYYRAGSAASTLNPDWIDHLDIAPRRVHVTGITLALGEAPRATVSRLIDRAREWDARVSFDLNFRLKLWSSEEAVYASRALLAHADDVLCSGAEGEALTGRRDPEEMIAKIRAEGPARVVVRLGADGAVGGDDAGVIASPAHHVERPLDSVGAGDAFAAGYLYELLRGATFEDALRTGNWVGAQVVANDGDYEGLPFRTEYDRWRSDRAEVQR